VTTTRIIPADPRGILHAAALIRIGQPVAIPSETVYGLAADAGDGAAVALIYAAKGRPSFNPLIVHVDGIEQGRTIARFDAIARMLAARFWPGPLTMVLPLAPGAPIAALVTAGLPTVALRMPAHPVMRAVIAESGRPLAAPSANASGTISPTSAAHVLRSLDGRIPLILDGGPSAHGLESTIVAPQPDRIVTLRDGPITSAMLSEATGLPVDRDRGEAIRAPGQLAAHYAPSKPLRLDAIYRQAGEWLIGFGAVAGDVSLSASGDLVEAAARLFALLHDADASTARSIAVAPIPHHGLGTAINDRLARAAVGSGTTAPAAIGPVRPA
jgi:L-threonylcarbamoyladenylate synthase